MSYIINNTSVLSGQIFSIVFTSSTLWKVRKKVPLSNAPPFGVNEDARPFQNKGKKLHRVPEAHRVLYKKCKSITDVTKPCVCVVMLFCWLYNMELCGVPFHRRGIHTELLFKCGPQMLQSGT